MHKTSIEWVINPDNKKGYVCNPVRGHCLHDCPYCYMGDIRRRFKKSDEMSIHPGELELIRKLKKPSTIFVGSSYDIWGSWVPRRWLDMILFHAAVYNQHTYLFLTKNPTRYLDTSYTPNCWLGTSTDTAAHANIYTTILHTVQHHYKFISAEPLLEDISDFVKFDSLSWLIIGSLNKNGRAVRPERGGTKREWVFKLIKLSEKYHVPIFIKSELYKLYPDLPYVKMLPYLSK